MIDVGKIMEWRELELTPIPRPLFLISFKTRGNSLHYAVIEAIPLMVGNASTQNRTADVNVGRSDMLCKNMFISVLKIKYVKGFNYNEYLKRHLRVKKLLKVLDTQCCNHEPWVWSKPYFITGKYIELRFYYKFEQVVMHYHFTTVQRLVKNIVIFL